MLKYSTDFPFLLIFDIHSCWMRIPITTCMKRLKKRDIKNWMYLAVVRSQIQLVGQRSNLLYNGKGSHKARYKLSVSCYIQIFSWVQQLITHAELRIKLADIIILFLPGLSFDQICFGLLNHILNFRNPWLNSLNLDANHQPNQLELAIPNWTPAVVDWVHWYPAHLY